jgi:hypothetical protein
VFGSLFIRGVPEIPASIRARNVNSPEWAIQKFLKRSLNLGSLECLGLAVASTLEGKRE